MGNLQNIRFSKYRFILTPEQTLTLSGFSGSLIRGTFGMAFRRICCVQRRLKSCKECSLAEKCAYSYIFETPVTKDSKKLSKNTYLPHPFIFDIPMDKKRIYDNDNPFTFYLTLIGRAIDYLPYFILTFDRIAQSGLGRERIKCSLSEVEAINEITNQRAKIYSPEKKTIKKVDSEYILNYHSVACSLDKETEKMTIRFVTPARLKYNGKFTSVPEFHIILRHLLRRISALSFFHCGEELQVDYSKLIKKAETVRIVDSHTSWREFSRYSRRQEQEMQLGGIVGEVTYEGKLKEFLPYIYLGKYLHIGKATAFGFGKYEVVKMS